MTEYYKHHLVEFDKSNGIHYWAIKKVWYNDHNEPYKIEEPYGPVDKVIHSEALSNDRIYAIDHSWKDNP